VGDPLSSSNLPGSPITLPVTTPVGATVGVFEKPPIGIVVGE